MKKQVENPKVVWSNFKGNKPGLEFEKIYIEFDSMPFKDSKVITYDLRDGVLLFITEVIKNMVICQICSTDRKAWIPQNYLKIGTEYKQISNGYSTN